MSTKNSNKWVACWGYDQTQYSVYEEVSRKGCFVIVRGYNSWACLHESDLYAGSKVKISKSISSFYDISKAEREIIAREYNWSSSSIDNFSEWESFRRFEIRKHREEAAVRTIVKVKHETNEKGYRIWVWELDNGNIIKEDDADIIVDIVDALTRKKIRRDEYPGETLESIKINDSICAYLDKNYDKNAQKYADQNEYTAYNGH